MTPSHGERVFIKGSEYNLFEILYIVEQKLNGLLKKEALM